MSATNLLVSTIVSLLPVQDSVQRQTPVCTSAEASAGTQGFRRAHPVERSVASEPGGILGFASGVPRAQSWLEIRLSGPGAGANAVVAADMDGDGDLDAIGAFTEDDTVAWFENVGGQGTIWGCHVVHDASVSAESVFPADLDGDGDLDLLSVFGSFPYQVLAHENLQGDGSLWETRVVGTPGAIPIGVFAADIDGDGDMDALTAADLGDEIAWFENLHADGEAWEKHVISAAVNAAQAVFGADVDGDGDTDVLSASGGNPVRWHENLLGDGSLWSEHVIDPSTDARSGSIAGRVGGHGNQGAHALPQRHAGANTPARRNPKVPDVLDGLAGEQGSGRDMDMPPLRFIPVEGLPRTDPNPRRAWLGRAVVDLAPDPVVQVAFFGWSPDYRRVGAGRGPFVERTPVAPQPPPIATLLDAC